MPEPTLTAAWWDKNRAKTLPSTGLGKVLTAFEKAANTFEKEAQKNPASVGTPQTFVSVKTALGELEKTLKLATAKCNKTLHKETIANLDKLTKTALPKERKRLDDVYKFWNAKQADRIGKLDTAHKRQEKETAALFGDVEKAFRRAEKEAGVVTAAVTAVMAASGKADKSATEKAIQALHKSRDTVIAALDEIAPLHRRAVAVCDTIEPWPDGMLDAKDPRQRNVGRIEAHKDAIESVMEGQAAALRDDVIAAVKDAEAAGRGELDANARVERELTRLVSRMDKAQFELDTVARRATSNVSQLADELDGHAKATDDATRERHKKAAGPQFEGAREQFKGFKLQLDGIVEDMKRTLTAAKGSVDTKSGPFPDLIDETTRLNKLMLSSRSDIAKSLEKYKTLATEYQKL